MARTGPRKNARRWAAATLVAAAVALTPPGGGIAAGQQRAAVVGPMTERSEPAVEAGRRFLRTLVDEANLPGLQVAVARGSELLWSDAFGFADLEERTPVTRLTRFRIGSLGKPLTAAAAVLLSESGRLELDAPIGAYLPELPVKLHPITTRQLLGHLSGIRHYREEESQIRYRGYGNVRETLELFVADSLLHPPGAMYEYSTYGYNLASAVIQSTAGRDFLAYMAETVFRPLRMRQTGADHVDSIIPNRASFYRESHEDGRLLNAPFTNNSYKWAGGGLLSTAEDLARFATALVAGQVVDSARVEEMFTPMVTAAGDTTGYGMGWRPRSDWRGRRVVRHGGSSVGGRAFLMVWPEPGLAVAILVNASRAPVFHEEAQSLAHFFLDHPSGVEGAGGDVEEIAGTYQFTSRRGDEEVTGLLRLADSRLHPGWMEWEGGAAPVPLVAVERHGDETRIIGAGVHGALNIWAKFAAGTFTGRWDWLGRTSEIHGGRTTGGPGP